MDPRIALYYMCSMAGVLMIAGGIWLIYKEKISIDRQSKQPIEIQSPLANFKSNYPALARLPWASRWLISPVACSMPTRTAASRIFRSH